MNAHLFEPDERGLVRACPQCGLLNRLTYERLGHLFRCASCKTELSPPAEPVEVPSTHVFDSMIARASQPVLVDFWAAWCGPCKMIAPELVKVAQAGAGQWLVAKVNTEDLPEVAARFRITGIPTLTLFRKGSEVARQAGVMPAPAVVQFIRNAIAA